MARYSKERLAVFLARPRTLAEIAKELGRHAVSVGQTRELPLPEGVMLFEQRDNIGQPLFKAVSAVHSEPEPARSWGVWCSKDQPYIWVQFPQNFKAERIKIAPLSDAHFGARAHQADRFREYVAWIRKEPHVFTFLNGDMIENAIDGSIGGAAYESIMTPSEQLWGKDDGTPGIIDLLRPIRHKIFWAQPGNHEWRTWKKANIDPTRIIARELGIPYFSEPIYADVLAWGQRFTFFVQHGASGAGTKGGKMNAASRPSLWQEHTHFIGMGHVHDSMANPVTRMVRERTFDEFGKLSGFRLVERTQYVVVFPSFHDYFENYGARAGYAPGSWGTVTCTLYNDGTYRASD